MKLVTKHFPGEFGSEILVQKVVNTILHHTAKKNPDEYNPVSIDGAHVQRLTDTTETPQVADPQPPTKIILTGQKAKTLHKEELTMSRVERSIQQSISEQAFVTQKRRTDKLKQEQKGQGRTSSPGGSPETSSSSAPATPTKSSSPSITNQFGVPPAQQCIRYGFPPKELIPPKDGEENEPVALQHGDRVTVEILRGPEDKSPAASIPRASSSHSGLHSVKNEDSVTSSRMSSRELQDSIDLEMSSLCLLATLMGEDVWSYAKKLPHLFQQGGVFYNIVKKDMGLMDGKHCTLPHLAGKTFVYNAAEERLELCVDAAGHFPVGPDVEELVKEALVQLRSEAASRGSREGSPSHGVLRLGSGGVVRKKEQLQSVTAFQGKGHSLGSAGGSSPPEHRPITRQHSSGVDLSASVSRGPPDLSDIPEDTTRELVRMAPGFVTMKDGRGLDPSLMEQQRRKLQEMVSSIQASMERHLREQQNTAATGGGASLDRTGGTKKATIQAASAAEPVAAAGVTAAGKPDEKTEEPEEMDSQDAGQSNATEPMDHS
uniref:Valosin containing protein (p97)/p47 complex interacting protein 1 n=1 Tax=Acanthochromis polyacanthus TaxID=80966 RepID=A0A3Q1I320_9TELE